MSQKRILFVCLGNICRSPTAEGIMRGILERQGLASGIRLDSAGTAGYHEGSSPDPRAMEAAQRRGYRLDGQRARPVCAADFHDFDLILGMDRANLSALEQMRPADARARVALLLEYTGNRETLEVPDPYYGGSKGFERVLDLVEEACEQLARELAGSR